METGCHRYYKNLNIQRYCNMDNNQTVLQMKYTRVINGIAERQKITRDEAMDRFFHLLHSR